MPSFSFDREMRQKIVVLNTGENITAIQDQELKCTWTMMVVSGTKALYSFGPDLLPISYSNCFPLPPENHLLRALQWTEEVMKPVGWKRSPVLHSVSSPWSMESCLHLFIWWKLSFEMEGEEMIFLQIWIFCLRIKPFGRQHPGYCVVTFL